MGWHTFFQGQTSPEITIEKKVDGAYENYNLYERTTNILAGQKDTFKIVISEPSGDENFGFFSHSGQLKVFLPNDAGLGLDEAALSFPSAGGQSDISLENDSLSSNKDTLFTDVNVNGSSQQDQITITDLIIEFPDDLANEDDFELKAWADFMDTSGDGAADTTEFELVNFKYTKPLLSITKQSTACYGEKVVCDLDITPDTLRYNLMVNDGLHKKVTHGDTAHFSYNDDVYLKDP